MNSFFHRFLDPLLRGWFWFPMAGVALCLSLLNCSRPHRPHNKGGSKLSAQNDVNRIVLAVDSFYNEYGSLPRSEPLLSEDTTVGSEGWLVDILTGDAPANPRGIVFLEPKPAIDGGGGLNGGLITTPGSPRFGSLVDPWGQVYVVVLDTNGDKHLENPDPAARAETPRFAKRVLVYSGGPDGNPDTWHDNITSWK